MLHSSKQPVVGGGTGSPTPKQAARETTQIRINPELDVRIKQIHGLFRLVGLIPK